MSKLSYKLFFQRSINLINPIIRDTRFSSIHSEVSNDLSHLLNNFGSVFYILLLRKGQQVAHCNAYSKTCNILSFMSYPFLFVYDTTPLVGKLGQEFLYLLYDTRPYSNLLLSEVTEDSVLLESNAKFGDYLRV